MRVHLFFSMVCLFSATQLRSMEPEASSPLPEMMYSHRTFDRLYGAAVPLTMCGIAAVSELYNNRVPTIKKIVLFGFKSLCYTSALVYAFENYTSGSDEMFLKTMGVIGVGNALLLRSFRRQAQA